MKKYELMFIINPELTKEDKEILIKDIASEIKAAKAKITSEDDWGARDLAYKIRGSKIGNYLLYNLESESGNFFELTKSFNLKKDIWRFMFVKLDD